MEICYQSYKVLTFKKMLKNYFHVSLRNLMKNRVFTLINIIGLGVALAVYEEQQLEVDILDIGPEYAGTMGLRLLHNRTVV